MDPISTAAGAAAAPSTGGLSMLAAPIASLAQTAFNAAFGSSQAKRQMRFQERMSSTAHQREVKDLYAAGLNPILSARYGGSSTPGGASAQPGHTDVGQSISSARVMESQVALQHAQTRDLNSAAGLKELELRQRGDLDSFGVSEISEKLNQLRSSSELTDTQRQQVEEAISKLQAEVTRLKIDTKHSALGLGKAYKEAGFWDSFGGTIAPWLKNILGEIPVSPVRLKIPRAPRKSGRWNRDGEWEGGD